MIRSKSGLQLSFPLTSGLPKTVTEYFAGIGLVRLGLERAGWQVEFANDFDPRKYEMYAAYFKDAEHHYSRKSVFDLDPDSIPDTTLATASFPCIDLSLAGNMNGLSGKHSSAFWGFIQSLRAKGERRPPFVMLENVPGWLTSSGGADFRLTIEALNDLGYACDIYSLDAVRFSAQSRLRIFVVGSRLGNVNGDTMALLKRPSSLAVKVVKDAVLANPDLRWNFMATPEPPRVDVSLADIVEEMNEDDPRWWSEEEAAKHLAMMDPLHSKRVAKLAAGDEWGYLTMFRRRRHGETRAEVRNDDKAGCLRTAKGGSSRQMLVAGRRGIVKVRHMTPREYARLQGVPDDYPIPKNTLQALNGFGDAVSVPVIAWLAEQILNPLAEEGEPAPHLEWQVAPLPSP